MLSQEMIRTQNKLSNMWETNFKLNWKLTNMIRVDFGHIQPATEKLQILCHAYISIRAVMCIFMHIIFTPNTSFITYIYIRSFHHKDDIFGYCD